MDTMHSERLKNIETAIAEALARIERQRQMIAHFQARGYEVRAPLTLLASLLLNLRRLEDSRREELRRETAASGPHASARSLSPLGRGLG